MHVGARLYCRTHWCMEIVDVQIAEDDHRPRYCHGQLEPVPAIRLSLFSDGDRHVQPGHGDRDFTKFTLPVEDPGSPTGYRQETIGSLADIRRLEKESEQRERDGEGRRMIWRDYSNDPSNKDRHTLAPDFEQEAPVTHFSNGTPVQIRRGEAVTADHGTVEADA